MPSEHEIQIELTTQGILDAIVASWQELAESTQEAMEDVDKPKRKNLAHVKINSEADTVLKSIYNDSSCSVPLIEAVGNLLHNRQDMDQFEFDYIGVEGDKITYLPPKKAANLSDPWTSKSRIKMRPGRFIKQVADALTPEDCEEFSKTFRIADHSVIEILDGEDIRDAYLGSNTNCRGTLGSSCMRHENCQEYLDIYVQEPGIKLAVIKEDGKIVARALLWELDNGETYLDRVYYSKDLYKTVFAKWAKAQNIEISYWAGDYEDENLKYTLKHRYYMYPYMDSFSRIDVKETCLYGEENYPRNAYGTQDEGGNNFSGMFQCAISGKVVPMEETTYLPDKKLRVHESLVSTCCNCSYISLKTDCKMDFTEIIDGDKVCSDCIHKYVTVEDSEYLVHAGGTIRCPISHKIYSTRVEQVYIDPIQQWVVEESLPMLEDAFGINPDDLGRCGHSGSLFYSKELVEVDESHADRLMHGSMKVHKGYARYKPLDIEYFTT